MTQTTLVTGRVLRTLSDPFKNPPQQALRLDQDHGLLIRDGHIADIGPAPELRKKHPMVPETAYGTNVIMPGFVDAHVHYPQTAIIASWGKQLIDWLNTYTFPEEMRFDDPAYCAAIATRYLDLTRAHGTTTMCSFTTIHRQSTDAFFTEAERRNQRVVAGKTCMDRNAPDGLRDTAQSAYDDSKSLLQTWHGRGRACYAITPRFTPTSTPDQLAALGALWGEYPDCLMQTHLSEQPAEITWVRDLHPQCRDYLDSYEEHGLLGPNGLYGHAIHLMPRERDRLVETGAALVHCPTSNTFIGSGLFDMAGLMAQGQRIGLASDTGGGSSFSMLRTMAAAYEIGQLRGTALHPAQLLWLATTGSAQALRLNDKIGKLATGYEADLAILDLRSTADIAQRAANASTDWEEIFPTLMMGDDRAIAATWINGTLAHSRAA